MSISRTLISSLIFDTLVRSKPLVDPTFAIILLKRLAIRPSSSNELLLEDFANRIECGDVNSLLLAERVNIFLET